MPKLSKQFGQFTSMLKSGAFVLKFEGFRYKKSGFIRDLFVSNKNYKNTVSHLPLISFYYLHRVFSLGFKVFHGLGWERLDYPYLHLQNICQRIIRFPFQNFYLKGTETTNHERQSF